MSAIAIITGICLVSVFVSYLALRRGFTRSADDYFVAGSSLGYFVLIFSMLASFLSAFCMFGMSGLGYRTGFGALFVLCVNLVPLGYLWRPLCAHCAPTNLPARSVNPAMRVEVARG